MAGMRKWLRFSLRTLLLLVTALCVWLGIQVNAARRQRDAVAAWSRAGGAVYYDDQIVVDPRLEIGYTFSRNPKGRAWPSTALGIDYFSVVQVAGVRESTIPESLWPQLADLPGLIAIQLRGAKTLPNDSGTPRRANDSDMAFIKDLVELKCVVLSDTDVGAPTLQLIADQTRIRYLLLQNVRIDETALKQIAKMTTLEHLSLSNTPITDAGLAYLAPLVNLKFLDLTSTNVSDAGLQHLKLLRTIVRLNLDDTDATTDGIRDLRNLLPNALVSGP
jgi:hypothetical protein